MKLTVGQTLWWVPSTIRGALDACTVTVTKVGRKWATISNGCRIGLDDLCADGGGFISPGCCYLSRDEYHVEVTADKTWKTLRVRINLFCRPKGVTTAQIIQAAKLLGVELS